ncbi:hypothetical protein [Chroococcidiopsis cubana]|uniref:hypothetical protein n=1 Tax=Chroococcidiopsis cubana TaxID=171392 RepID=UPI002ACE5FB7|nr:hypothetical protein [Chroococcidiopsis cubana]
MHIYYPLPKAISSFGVACAVKWTLFDKGILLGDGQLETFPNTKSYGSDGNLFNISAIGYRYSQNQARTCWTGF